MYGTLELGVYGSLDLRILSVPPENKNPRTLSVPYVGTCFSAVVMPLCDSDIPMNVPIMFRNKQPFHRAHAHCV